MSASKVYEGGGGGDAGNYVVLYDCSLWQMNLRNTKCVPGRKVAMFVPYSKTVQRLKNVLFFIFEVGSSFI